MKRVGTGARALTISQGRSAVRRSSSSPLSSPMSRSALRRPQQGQKGCSARCGNHAPFSPVASASGLKLSGATAASSERASASREGTCRNGRRGRSVVCGLWASLALGSAEVGRNFLIRTPSIVPITCREALAVATNKDFFFFATVTDSVFSFNTFSLSLYICQEKISLKITFF